MKVFCRSPATVGYWGLLPMAIPVSVSRPCSVWSGLWSWVGGMWTHSPPPSTPSPAHRGKTWKILHDVLLPSPGVAQPNPALEMQSSARRTGCPLEHINPSVREASAPSGTRESLLPEEGLAVGGCPRSVT